MGLAAAIPLSMAAAVGRLDPFVILAAMVVGMLAFVAMRPGSDVVTILTLALVAQMAIPNRLVFTPLGSAGSIGQLFGMALAGLWAGSQIVAGTNARQRWTPLRVAVFALVAANLLSMAAAQLRPLSMVEARAADRGLLITLSMVGVCMLAADGIPNRERLDTLLRRLVMAGGGVAALGLLAFVGGPDIASSISIPGLGVLGEAYVDTRSSFTRVNATMAHAIEFSVVLAMILPLAIHYALFAKSNRDRWWMLAALIAAAIPMSLSRSGVVGVAVVALMLIPSWPARLRSHAYWLGAGYLVIMRLLFPGLLGTIKALFLNVGVDPSINSRTQDYDYVGSFVSETPIFGRGFGTFIPSIYDFLDNQYLVTLIEVGVVGLVALVMLFVTGLSVARGVRHRAADEETRNLGQSLAAGIAVAAINSATFDFLGFSTARFVLLILLGCAGALWSIDRESRSSESLEWHDPDVPTTGSAEYAPSNPDDHPAYATST
ncbi:MAG: O-antigen ligase domain-containing protein [Acidimicrobiales bacterium]|nr:O-antigen ligase domain-containing protein [Acidimicrobiales bacterium]